MRPQFMLTIDDGPTQFMKEKLEILTVRNIPAVWFCLGQNIPNHREFLLNALQNGHLIGNHSFDHPYFSTLTVSEAEHQITATDDLIEQLYVEAGVRRPGRYFRFPFGDQGNHREEVVAWDSESMAKKQQFQELLAKLGFTNPTFPTTYYGKTFANQESDRDWLWSYDIQEWAINNPGQLQLTTDQVQQNLNAFITTAKTKQTITILTHDHEYSHQHFEALIAQLQRFEPDWVLPVSQL